MGATIPLDLSGGSHLITADAGDNLAWNFVAKTYDTTGWQLEFRFYKANQSKDGPDGAVLSGLTLSNGSGITNTPNTMGGDSVIGLAVPSATTLNRDGTSLWTEFVKVNSGAVRTLSKGLMVLQ
jgi:hypothetical protein